MTAPALLTLLSGTRLADLKNTSFTPFIPMLSSISGVPEPQLDLMRRTPFHPNHHHETIRDFPFHHCPLCLAGDEVPYLRALWRSPRSTLCSVHRTPLNSACPACRATLWTRIFLRKERTTLDWRRCPRCHTPYGTPAPGQLAPSHGGVWLEHQRLHPDTPDPALLPSGQRIGRPLLDWLFRYFLTLFGALSRDHVPKCPPALAPWLLRPVAAGLTTPPGPGTALHLQLLLGTLLDDRTALRELLGTLIRTFPDAQGSPAHRPLPLGPVCIFLMLLADERVPEISELSLSQLDLDAVLDRLAAYPGPQGPPPTSCRDPLRRALTLMRQGHFEQFQTWTG